MKTEYSPHGKCLYNVADNIITIDATGPWNLEFFRQMHRELSQHILNDVDYHNFAILLILKGESLATQDGLDYHLSVVKTGPTKALAIIANSCDSPPLSQSMFQKIYNQAGLKNQAFNDIDAAKAWLKSQLS